MSSEGSPAHRGVSNRFRMAPPVRWALPWRVTVSLNRLARRVGQSHP